MNSPTNWISPSLTGLPPDRIFHLIQSLPSHAMHSQQPDVLDKRVLQYFIECLPADLSLIAKSTVSSEFDTFGNNVVYF